MQRWGGSVLALALTGACGGDPDDEDTTGGETTGGGPTTDEPTTGEATAVSTDASTVGTEDTGDPSTGPGTTTGAEPGLPGACATYCDNAAACLLEEDAAECSALCGEDLAGEGACGTASEAWAACLATLSCEQLTALYDADDPGPCGEALQAWGRTCDEDTCNHEASGSIDGSECSVELMCPAEPMQAAECDTETCVCFADGVQTGTCASRGVCAAIDRLDGVDAFIDFVRECCGF